MSPTLQRLFDDYARFHRHPMNRMCHKVGIPLIVFHIIAMLDWMKLAALPVEGGTFALSLGHVAFVAAMAWYVAMSRKLAAILAVAFGLCFPIAAATPVWAVIAIAVAGWIVQLLGHVAFEKNQPAFVTNLIQTLVGPAFFLAVLIGDYPTKRVPEPALATEPLRM